MTLTIETANPIRPCGRFDYWEGAVSVSGCPGRRLSGNDRILNKFNGLLCLFLSQLYLCGPTLILHHHFCILSGFGFKKTPTTNVRF